MAEETKKEEATPQTAQATRPPSIADEMNELKHFIHKGFEALEDETSKKASALLQKISTLQYLAELPLLERTDCTPCVCDQYDAMQQFCTDSEYGVSDGEGFPVSNESIAAALTAIAKIQMHLGIANYQLPKKDYKEIKERVEERIRNVDIARLCRVMRKAEDYLAELIREHKDGETTAASDLADDLWDARHGIESRRAVNIFDGIDPKDVQRLLINQSGNVSLFLVIPVPGKSCTPVYMVTGNGATYYYHEYNDALIQYNHDLNGTGED